MSEKRTFVSLGSSFAAGPTIEPVADPDAMRSKRNYAHIAAEVMGVNLIDLTVSGATTSTILEESHRTGTGATFAPQIQGVPANADIVTVTAGGNDLHFLGSMLYTAWSMKAPNSPLTQMMGQEFATGIPSPTEHSIEAVVSGLTRIVSAVRDRARSPRILLVDYLTIIPADARARASLPFTPKQTESFADIQAALAAAFRLAAERSGAELLAASELSRDHGLGTKEPWIFGFKSEVESTSGSYHPNEDGMLAVAHEIVRHLTA
ncbi:GDSL-type esterase/lipase family protein [Rothia uropygioeca]|uniref:GDSL-type esterase/lipase family protein n=1 Tax=Kocuria sp. 257 TaxID=2021970 RepID=UPI0010133819|nr:GDSL-type esterase/lipase family protein [Kocuria sp. 257]